MSSYPDADEMADIDEIGTLIKALGGLRHERLWEIADYFLRRCSYLSFFRLHDTNTVTTIIKVLMKMPRSNELEKYLLDIMVEYEEEYPSVGEMIGDYL